MPAEDYLFPAERLVSRYIKSTRMPKSLMYFVTKRRVESIRRLRQEYITGECNTWV